MRQWLLILMIALLPLRGWAGDAMTVSMWAEPVTPQVTAPCHGGSADMGAVAEVGNGHHAAGAMAHGGESDQSASHTTCTACDICNGPAMAMDAPTVRTAAPVHDHVAPASVRFASAEPQLGSKPPIA
jgi:hypothetical protein